MDGNGIGTILLMLVGLAIGAGVGYWVARTQFKVTQRDVEVDRARILEEAQLQAKEVALAAKDEAIKIRDEAEVEQKRRRAEWQREDERLARKGGETDQKMEKKEQRGSEEKTGQ